MTDRNPSQGALRAAEAIEPMQAQTEYRILRRGWVTLRRERECALCCGILIPGQCARVVVYLLDGNFQQEHRCERCENAHGEGAGTW